MTVTMPAARPLGDIRFLHINPFRPVTWRPSHDGVVVNNAKVVADALPSDVDPAMVISFGDIDEIGGGGRDYPEYRSDEWYTLMLDGVQRLRWARPELPPVYSVPAVVRSFDMTEMEFFPSTGFITLDLIAPGRIQCKCDGKHELPKLIKNDSRFALSERAKLEQRFGAMSKTYAIRDRRYLITWCAMHRCVAL